MISDLTPIKSKHALFLLKRRDIFRRDFQDQVKDRYSTPILLANLA